MKIIAVSGVARAGKDTISDGLSAVIRDMNPSINVMRFSFAEELKLEMAPFLIEKFNIDPFKADGKDKELIRPLLIAHGQARREQTQGRYWIDCLDKKINGLNPDIAIVSDLRFAQKDADEYFWLREKGGKLIHVSRFHVKTKNGKSVKEFVKPASVDEANNDPFLKKNADFTISWPDSSCPKELAAMTKEYCEEFYYKNIQFLS